MDSVQESHVDESAWLQPSVYPGSGLLSVEVYPPVVERGASVRVRCRIRCPSIFHPPKSEVSFRALAVVLDAGKMAERGLMPEKVIEHRLVSLEFMCGGAKFEAWKMVGKKS